MSWVRAFLEAPGAAAYQHGNEVSQLPELPIVVTPELEPVDEVGLACSSLAVNQDRDVAVRILLLPRAHQARVKVLLVGLPVLG